LKAFFKESLQKNFRIILFLFRRELVSFNLEKLWIFNLSRFQVVNDMLLCEAGIRKKKIIMFDSLQIFSWLTGNPVLDYDIFISFNFFS